MGNRRQQRLATKSQGEHRGDTVEPDLLAQATVHRLASVRWLLYIINEQDGTILVYV